MTKPFLFLAAAATLGSSPALASGGMFCSTAGPRPVQVSMTIGHVFGSPLVDPRLTDNGRRVPVAKAQWWLDRKEVRLLLTDPNATREELVLRATRKGQAYDGTLWRGGQRRWVRCREG
jgi:hypothetical protein